MAQVSADLVLNIDEALSQIEALGDLISDVTSNVVVDVGVDTTEAEAGIESLDDQPVEVPVDADVSAAEGEIGDLDSETVEVPVEADTSEAEAEISGLDADTVVVPVEADVSDAEGEIASLDGESVEVTVSADTAQASDAIGQLSEQTESLGGAGSSAALGLGGLNTAMENASIQSAAAGAGIAAIATGLTASVTAFAEADGALAITTQAIENLGASSGVTIEGVQALATNLLETAGISDEATLAAAGLIARFGTLNNRVGEGNDIFDRTLILGADLATLMGTDITSAANLLGRALADPEAGMSRLQRVIGPLDQSIQDNIISLQQSGDLLGAQRLLLDAVADSVEGTAAAYGESLAGQLDITRESLGELAEAIGGLLAPAISDLAADASELTTNISDLIGVFQGWGDSVGGVVDALGPVGDFLSTIVGTAADLLSPIQSGIEAFNGLAREVTGADKAFAGFDLSAKTATDELPVVDAAVQATADAIDVIETATTDAEAAFDAMVDAFLSGGPDLSSAISAVEGNLNDFGETIDDATDARLVLDNLDQSIEAFRDFADNLETIGQTSTEVRDVLAVINPEIAGGLAEALASGNPALIRQFETRIRQIRRFGGDAVELFGGQATDSAEAWEDGLRPLPNVTRSLTERSIRAVEAQRNNARGAGRTVGDNMTDGVERGVDGMSPAARRGVNEASNAARAARNTAASGGRSVGNALTEGMAEGIVARIPAVTAAARNAVAAAVQAAQNEAGISSPSKVFMAMGEEMVEGMALGLMDVDPVVAAAAYLADAAISEISQKKNEWDAAILGPSGVLPEEAAKATWLANADPSFSAIYMPAPADDGGQRDGTPVYNFTLNIDAANQDPVAVGDAVVSAVEASLFRASVVGARRRRG